ncbi:hypothetical protein EQ481_21495 [Escherichia coli]|nr:hypothetical protein [Escherichia coli]EFO2426318.1 hypothetical protein [Escherichia coli]EFO2751982.1 hypothetical protein [Escherichia coli]
MACLINDELVKKAPPLLIPAIKTKIKLIKHDHITNKTEIDMLKDISRENTFTEIEMKVKKEANKAMTPSIEFLAVITSDSKLLTFSCISFSAFDNVASNCSIFAVC